jgi:hypothetical protein
LGWTIFSSIVKCTRSLSVKRWLIFEMNFESDKMLTAYFHQRSASAMMQMEVHHGLDRDRGVHALCNMDEHVEGAPTP